MKPYARSERVSGNIQRLLSELMLKGVKDPRLSGTMITSVEMTPDLKTAYIYFIAHGGEKEKNKALKGFESARGYLKKEVGARLGLRYTPELRFRRDSSFEYGSRIEEVLATLNHESDSSEAD